MGVLARSPPRYRGTLTTPGRDSPHRTRSVEENLRLFEAMAAGEVPGGIEVEPARPSGVSAFGTPFKTQKRGISAF